MSFTFAKALGGKIGNSIHEDSMLDEVNEIIKIAKNNNVKVHIPVDVVCAKEFDNNSPAKVFDIMNIDKDYEGMDAGPKSLLKFKEVVLNSIKFNEIYAFTKFAKKTFTKIKFKPFFKNSFSAIIMPVKISFIRFSSFDASASSLIAIGFSSSSLIIRPYHLGLVTCEVRTDIFFLWEDLINFLNELELTSGTSA